MAVSKPLPWPSRLPAINQVFPFPPDVMNRVLYHPISPKTYLKTVKCAKIFFEKNPILILGPLENHVHRGTFRLCTCESCQTIFLNEEINNRVKLWFIDGIYYRGTYYGQMKLKFRYLCNRLWSHKISFLRLTYSRVLLDDLKKISDSTKVVEFCNVDVLDKSASLATPDCLVATFPNAVDIKIECSPRYLVFKNHTFDTIYKTMCNSVTLKAISLYGIPKEVEIKIDNDIIEPETNIEVQIYEAPFTNSQVFNLNKK